MKTKRPFLAAFLVCATSLTPFPVMADSPVFRLPASCRLGSDCWIVNYVDTAAAKGEAKDYHCGPLTYDDHNGTDVGLADLVSMEMGVDVLAAASGTVLRVREGVEDKIVTPEERQQLLAEDKGCGNGVFIDHGDGWQTIYCHMKKDSIAVKPGQKIAAGAKLGQIGLSGIAEFPHVHFGVFHDGHAIDPFTGHGSEKGCAAKGRSLWDAAHDPGYAPASIYAVGFKDGAPDFEAVKIDARGAKTLSPASEALTFWVSLYGVAAGDRITIEIRKPDGSIFAARDILQDKDRARQFYFVGRKTGADALVVGTYTGNVRLERTGVEGPPVTRSQTLAVR